VRYTSPHDDFGCCVTKRSLFVVDGDGTVRYRWVTDDAWEQPDLMGAKERLEELVA